jgi:nucleoside-diphosphate-sugar epimerase
MTSDATSSGTGTKVTVVGGTGFVGSKVCKSLTEKGVAVISVSKSGKIPTFAWCDDIWTSRVKWIAANIETADEAALDASIGSPDCLVSCLGVVGNDPDKLMKGNGDANCAAFSSAKRGGKVQRAVFVSVSSEVMACEENWLPAFFKGYFDGKKMAEQCALDAVDGDSSRVCFVKPTFIYGGDSFGLLPPRVNMEYGSFIEELLSLGIIKFLADATPGLIKVALRPPSSVDAVAEACVSAALEGPALGKVLDGGAEINEITNHPPATGLTDAIEFAKVKTGDFIEWAKEEVPKAVAKIEKMQKQMQK